MATTLQLDAGTNGWVTTPVNLLTTELNSLASGAAATSSVGGTSGVFSQTNFSNGPLFEIWFTSGGTFTPALGQQLVGWFLKSTDGGTTFETLVATPSSTVNALSRNPDFIIPLDNAAFASTNIRFGTIANAPAPSFKVVLQNLLQGGSATALPASGNKITAGPYSYQQV
jgi:hypothetical protein